MDEELADKVLACRDMPQYILITPNWVQDRFLDF